ncbi:MAG: hypothetical protein ACOCVG_03115, partial [Verrucomicrobiota bacterium]
MKVRRTEIPVERKGRVNVLLVQPAARPSAALRHLLRQASRPAIELREASSLSEARAALSRAYYDLLVLAPTAGTTFSAKQAAELISLYPRHAVLLAPIGGEGKHASFGLPGTVIDPEGCSLRELRVALRRAWARQQASLQSQFAPLGSLLKIEGLELLPAPVLIASEAGRLVHANTAARELIGNHCRGRMLGDLGLSAPTEQPLRLAASGRWVQIAERPADHAGRGWR